MPSNPAIAPLISAPLQLLPFKHSLCFLANLWKLCASFISRALNVSLCKSPGISTPLPGSHIAPSKREYSCLTLLNAVCHSCACMRCKLFHDFLSAILQCPAQRLFLRWLISMPCFFHASKHAPSLRPRGSPSRSLRRRLRSLGASSSAIAAGSSRQLCYHLPTLLAQLLKKELCVTSRLKKRPIA